MAAACALLIGFTALERVSAATTLAVIVNPQNPVADLSVSRLRDIIMGQVALWPNGRRVTVVLRDESSSERAGLLQVCCRLTPDQFRRRTMQNVFRGDSTAEPRSVESVAEMKNFVASLPGAIGFIAIDQVDASVKVVRIGGRAPTDQGYLLTIP